VDEGFEIMSAGFYLGDRYRLSLVLCLLAFFGEGRGDDKQEVPRSDSKLPAFWDAKNKDAFVNAAQVWRFGKDFFDEKDRWGLQDENDKVEVFKGIDQKTGHFLSWPGLRPAVQFSHVSYPTPYEDALEEVLSKGLPETKVQALAILMKVSASSSVPQQWKALTELSKLKDREQWKPLLAEWQKCFDPQALKGHLQNNPPADEYARAPETFLWAIRAAGVIRNEGALERLVQLSCSDNIDTSLAAERSLEDFTGARANQALASCLLGWRYNAYVHAGDALVTRDKELLVKTLLNAKVPPKCRVHQGIFLARCNHPAAVPILCEELPTYQIIDKEMFEHISRLGLREHAELIKALPTKVRPDQREEAEKAVQAYLRRK
jgi:hypothetical protein